jgi:hypothetical protein
MRSKVTPLTGLPRASTDNQQGRPHSNTSLFYAGFPRESNALSLNRHFFGAKGKVNRRQ